MLRVKWSADGRCRRLHASTVVILVVSLSLGAELLNKARRCAVPKKRLQRMRGAHNC
jgi:hypothetical protein